MEENYDPFGSEIDEVKSGKGCPNVEIRGVEVKEEQRSSTHAPKVGTDAMEAKDQGKAGALEMAKIGQQLHKTENVAVHPLLTLNVTPEAIASCAEATSHAKAPTPAMASPTLLGAVALEAGRPEEGNEGKVKKALKQDELLPLKRLAGTQ